MSEQMSVFLSTEPAPAHWGEKAILFKFQSKVQRFI